MTLEPCPNASRELPHWEFFSDDNGEYITLTIGKLSGCLFIQVMTMGGEEHSEIPLDPAQARKLRDFLLEHYPIGNVATQKQGVVA